MPIVRSGADPYPDQIQAAAEDDEPTRADLRESESTESDENAADADDS